MASVDQHEKIGRRCLICGECRAAEQKRLRFCACQTVCVQAVDRLKERDGVLRLCAECAVRGIAEITQVDERLLKFFDVRAGRTFFQGACGFGGRCRGWCGCRNRRALCGVGRRRFGNEVCAAITILCAKGRIDRRSRGSSRLRRGRRVSGRGTVRRLGKHVEIRRLQKGRHACAERHDGAECQRGEQDAHEPIRQRFLSFFRRGAHG